MNNNDNEITPSVLEEERVLLATERTFSAWIRTALTAMAGGLAILRLISFKSEFHRTIAYIIGEILILWGGVVIIFSAIDYKKTCNKLLSTKNYKGYHTAFLIIVTPLLLIAVLLVWVTLPK